MPVPSWQLPCPSVAAIAHSSTETCDPAAHCPADACCHGHRASLHLLWTSHSGSSCHAVASAAAAKPPAPLYGQTGSTGTVSAVADRTEACSEGQHQAATWTGRSSAVLTGRGGAATWTRMYLTTTRRRLTRWRNTGTGVRVHIGGAKEGVEGSQGRRQGGKTSSAVVAEPAAASAAADLAAAAAAALPLNLKLFLLCR